jgi:thioredoxin 1
MKNIFFIALASLSLVGACKPNTGNSQEAEKLALNPAEFEQKAAALPDEQLVDVRTPQEFGEGKLQGAINIDYNSPTFQQTALSSLDKSKPILVYCYSGGRSGEAATFLRSNGYTVYELAGGVKQWKQEAKPVETAATPAPSDQTQEEGVISLADFNKKVSGNKPVLVDFSAVWCMPCKRMKPTIDKIAVEMTEKIDVIMVDVDKSEDVAKAYKIEAMPTLMLFRQSKVVWEKIGETQEEEIKGAIGKL